MSNPRLAETRYFFFPIILCPVCLTIVIATAIIPSEATMLLLKAMEVNPLMPTIRELRIAAGLTQNELAIKSGYSYITISRIERGYSVQKSTARAVCAALNASPENVEIVVKNRVNANAAK